MKLCMTLLVRDEEDILDTHIRFHLARGVDFIIATDNLSEDRSPEILRGFERQGVLHLIREPEDDYSQAKWVTRMARMAATEYGADWVINSDADEFWWPERGNLESALASLPKDVDVVTAPRLNFVPRSEHLGPIFDRMTVREVQSLNPLGEPLPPKVCHRAFPDIKVEQGNHAVLGRDLKLLDNWEQIVIFHFPMRSYSQFANKIRKGGRAYARNTALPPEMGSTWRELYRLYERGELEEYYARHEVQADEIEEGIRHGRLVPDKRLQAFLTALR